MRADLERIRERLQAAQVMEPGESRTEQVREVVRHAEAAGDTRLLVDARLLLLRALDERVRAADSRSWTAWCRRLTAAYVRCQSLYERAPEHFTAQGWETLWHTMYLVVDRASQSAERSDSWLGALIDSMEPHCSRPGREDPCRLHLDAARFDLAERAGDLAAANALLSRLRDLTSDDGWVADIARLRIDLLIRGGRDAEAIEAAHALRGGQGRGVDRRHDRVEPRLSYLLLLPCLRTGRLAEARRTHQRIMGRYRKEHDVFEAPHLEFLARSGNEDLAWNNLRLRASGLAVGEVVAHARMTHHAAVALVCHRLTRLGRGTETINVRLLDTAQASPHAMTAAELYSVCAEHSMRFARKADACHGNTYQSERVHALIHAEPIVDHLPLSPASEEQ